MTKFVLVLALLVAAVSSMQPDCLSYLDFTPDELIGKQFVADGRRLSKNFIPFDHSASVIKESRLNLGQYRVITPHTMVTADYSPTRLNIYVDDEGKVTGINCA